MPTRIPHPVDVCFRNEGEMKRCSDKQVICRESLNIHSRRNAKMSSASIRKIIPELRVEIQEGLKSGRKRICVCKVKEIWAATNKNNNDL